jgi:uncharacterized membrane protein
VISLTPPAVAPPRTALRIPYLLAGLCFAGYTAYSVALHRTFQTTGFDLGIFEQAVRSYAEGRWPVADLKGPGYPLLGDHFHPLLALLAPFYLLAPGPETLLVAQAALLATSVMPVTRLAVRTLGPDMGTVVGVGYGASWGLLSAVAFDFHEICFAVPLLAFALENLALARWRAAVAWALPLFLVKEDLPFTVAAIGFYLIWQRQRRLGAPVAGAGVVTGALLFLVVLPALNPVGHYDHWYQLDRVEMSTLAGLAVRAGTVLYLLAPTAFTALRSPVLLVALPTLAWRFGTGNPSYWGTGFHYSAVLMPIVFIAFVDGLRRLGGTRGMTRWAGPTCLVVTALLLVIHIARPPSQPQWTTEQQATAARVLATIPDGASVAASNRLAPHLTDRCHVLLFPNFPSADTAPEWVVLARPFVGWPTSPAHQLARLAAVEASGYDVVTDAGSVILLRHRQP